MKKTLLTAIFIISLFSLAKAHPLGNFSINQYTGIEVSADKIKLRQFVDMAEIPTFQESQNIDTNNDDKVSDAELKVYLEKITPNYVPNLLLSVDSKKIPLQISSTDISLLEGSGDLKTLRIEWILNGDLPFENLQETHKLKFENRNYAERLGWNEIVAGRVEGINIFDSNVYGSGMSNELKAYPQESLNAPLVERSGEFSFTSSALPENANVLENRDGHTTAAIQTDRFAELIAVPEITPSIILLGLLIAFGLGAMHAMSPGHGKAVVGAYLVGSKGTPKHAIFLGLVVTVTHTFGVFVLGFLTLFASNYILPERIMPFLNFFSGLLVLFIGLSLFKDRILKILGYKSEVINHHDQANFPNVDHDYISESEVSEEKADYDHQNVQGGFVHTHGGSTHSHLPPEKVSFRNLLGLGISGGLLPCPSALVLMLSAISLNRIGYGLILTIFFSIGLASTLTAVGLAFLYIGKIFENRSLAENRIVQALPAFSAFVIACLGAVICYNSLM